MKKTKKNLLAKTTLLFLAIFTLFNSTFASLQVVFAAVATGKYIARIYDTSYKDNTGKDIFKIRIQGDEIPALTDTGFGQVTFCLNHHMDHPTKYVEFNRSDDFTTSNDFIESARIAYLGYYRYSNAAGNASKSLTGRADDVQYAYTASLIWQNLGQMPSDYSLDSEFDTFKKEIMDEYNKWDILPSFNSSVQSLNLGETKTLTDNNGVLKYYESFDYEKDGVTFKHTKGKNTMTISASEDVNKTTISLTRTDARNNGIGKYINNRKVQTNFILSPLSGDTTHQRFLVGYGYNDPKYLLLQVNINLYGNLEIAKKDNRGNFVENTTFKLSYNSDMSNAIGTYTTNTNGKVTVENLRPAIVYIQETSVPSHLQLDTSIHSITIKADETASYTATNNWKQGYLKVTKKDADTGKIVKKAGTVFDIYSSSNNKVTSITTNAEGIATSGLLDYGTYYIKESKSPNKYTLQVNISDKVGVVENGKTYEVVISNKRVTGSVTISKEDSVTGKTPQGEATLKGATYGVYARNAILDPADDSVIYKANEKIGELLTDENANASMNNLYLGEYYIKELIPSEGYTLDTNTYNFDLTYENQNTNVITKKLTVKEKVKSQAFQIIKVSSDENGEAELLEKAEFTIKLQNDIDKFGSWEKAPIAKNADGETAAILVTDSKGYAVSERLPFGVYIIRETKVPANKYKVPDFTVVISEDSDEIQTWRVFNDTSFKAVLAIVKQDAETQKVVKISGAKFKIKNIETGEYFGYWSWNPLPRYTDSWVTDETGTVMTAEQLPAGKYQLEEQSSPEGYLICKTPVKFEITSNTAYETLPDGSTPVITVKVKNESAKGKISVEKTGEVLVSYTNNNFIYEEKGIANAKYQVIARENILDACNDGTILYKKGAVVQTLVTDNSGKATSKELPLGEYSVKEVEAPEGFVLNDEVKNVSLKYKDQETPLVFDNASFVNERQKVDITVDKKDSDENIGLFGAEFSLYAKKDIKNYKGEVIVKAGETIEKTSSNIDGKVKFISDLPLSNYEIKETKAPIGYSSNNKVISVDANYKGQETKVIKLEYEFKNEIIKVEVSKQDITNSEEISGAHLTVFEKGNEGAIFDTWISGSDGKNKDGTLKKHLIKGLEVEKTYVLREISSPYGYTISQDVEFTITDTGEIQSVKMSDELVYGKLKFNKYGEIFNQVVTGQTEYGKTESPVWNKSNLLDTEITIYANADIVIGNTTYYKKDEKIQTLESDWDPVYSKNLPVGSYYYLETKVPHGYVADTNKHYFSIEDTKTKELQIIESTLINTRAKVNIDMTKVLEEQEIFKNPDAYKDITFGIFAREDIYDYMGNVAIENETMIATTGITGKGLLEDVPDLPIGVYYLKELSTNSQYILNNSEYGFEIGYQGKDISEYIVKIGIEGKIENKLARGEIQVKKVDILDENKKLENIEFNISTKKDMSKILSTEKTNSEGIATFKDLELGTYYIQESKQVDGYTANNTIYKVEVNSNAAILVINCGNKPTEAWFRKVDETGVNELHGATIKIIDKETKEIVDEWVSTKEPHIVNYLIEGKEYIMKEINSPYGYQVSEEIHFTMKDGIRVVMKNNPILKTIKLIKIDKETEEVIKDNFTFGLYIDKQCTQLIQQMDSNVTDGSITFKNLRYGTYYIKEITAPNGYTLSKKNIKVEINDKGVFVGGKEIEEKELVYSFTFENQAIPQIQTGNEMNYILLIGSAVISVIGIITGVVLLKKKKTK